LSSGQGEIPDGLSPSDRKEITISPVDVHRHVHRVAQALVGFTDTLIGHDICVFDASGTCNMPLLAKKLT
jgi:hypothetical protein